MPLEDSEFSGAVSFTMLHHVPSQELQNKVLAEVLRVLKPGGFFVGSDSLQNCFMRIIHIGDTLGSVNPDTSGRDWRVRVLKCWRCKSTRKLSDSVLDDHQRRLSKHELGNETTSCDDSICGGSYMNTTNPGISRVALRNRFFSPFCSAWRSQQTALPPLIPTRAQRIRQIGKLDYWLGNWKISAVGSPGNARSTVTLSLDKCLVVENWDGGEGPRWPEHLWIRCGRQELVRDVRRQRGSCSCVHLWQGRGRQSGI